MQIIPQAVSLARLSAGNSMAARIAIIAITTSSSMRVNTDRIGFSNSLRLLEKPVTCKGALDSRSVKQLVFRELAPSRSQLFFCSIFSERKQNVLISHNFNVCFFRWIVPLLPMPFPNWLRKGPLIITARGCILHNPETEIKPFRCEMSSAKHVNRFGISAAFLILR